MSLTKESLDRVVSILMQANSLRLVAHSDTQFNADDVQVRFNFNSSVMTRTQIDELKMLFNLARIP